eukprot:Phypoly_transcript_04026.p1 GENE.Phypoly_transcript_04026~~Phypoly_transcript_04026.p1  ORF type:complete len:302 (+),score=39.97 Phypoly_transcript_04026:1312-2217(+)
MLASVARHNDELTKAEILMTEVAKSLKEIYDEPSMDAALAFFCAATYYPAYVTKAKFCYSHAWQLAKTAPTLNLRDVRLKAFIYTMHKLSDHSISLSERNLSIAEYININFTTLGDFEVTTLQIVRVIGKIGAKIDITDARAALRVIPTVHFTTSEKMDILLDIKVLDFLMNNVHCSLMPMTPYIKAMKVLVLWKSGDIENATEEAIAFCKSLETHHENYFLFYSDILMVFLMVVFFKDTNNQAFFHRMGLCAKHIVHRTLQNSHFHFYKELLEEVFPNSMEPVIALPDDSVFDFLFGDIP